jgi:hypothetical protein
MLVLDRGSRNAGTRQGRREGGLERGEGGVTPDRRRMKGSTRAGGH